MFAKMRIHFTKRFDNDLISIHRDDGTHVSITFPKKGQIPHDAIHLIVEQQLGLRTGFWGRVASGSDPKEVGLIAKAGGHISAKRARSPDASIVELVQAERLVECFEADMSGNPADVATFLGVLKAACTQSRIPISAITEAQLGTIHSQLGCLKSQWQRLSTGESIRLDWI